MTSTEASRHRCIRANKSAYADRRLPNAASIPGGVARFHLAFEAQIRWMSLSSRQIDKICERRQSVVDFMHRCTDKPARQS